MKTKFLFVGTLVAAAAFLASCATTIPVSVTHPPAWDTNGVERMAVRPFTGSGDRAQVAEDLTRLFRDRISGLGTFQMVEQGGIDAYFTGEVTNYASQDTSEQRTRKNKDGTTTPYTVYTRKVSLGFSYYLVRDRDGTRIGQKTITCNTQDSDENPGNLRPALQLALNAAQNQLKDFNRDLVPWISNEKLTLDKTTFKDKAHKNRMKEAEKLVKAGSYQAAQNEYAKIYQETGDLAAGYNQAILAQPLDSLEAAVALLSKLDYGKARTEQARLQRFIGENAAAAASTAGTSQQELAIQKASQGLIASLPPNSKVSLVNISQSEKDMVDVVIRETTDALVATGITVLDRNNTALIDAEKQYQASGEVSDDSYVSIGKMLGVDTIVTFSITGTDNQRKLTVKSLSVETGAILYNDSTEI